MAERIYRNNFFLYGEVGERLNGVRESEVYEQSAQVIRNFTINELGNLKVAKQFTKTNNSIRSVVEVLDTRNDYYIVVTSNEIKTLRKSNNQVLYTLNHGLTLTKSDNCKMFEDKLIICGPTPKVFEFNKDTGNIGTSNFLDLLKYPVIDKEDVKMDLYKIYKVGEELRVSLLTTYTNPKLEIKSNKIHLYDTGVEIKRIYKQYKASITKDDITGAVEGMVFGVFYRYTKNDKELSNNIGNTKVNFTGATNDAIYGSEYFTTVDVATAEGELVYGELKVLNSNFIDSGLFQNRLYLIHDGVFYFSKIDNHFDFRNGTQSDSAFFFKPNPINNQKPTILKSKVGNGIYVVTNKGVYVVGYNKVLTPTSFQVYIAGEVPGTNECELIGDNFYYIAESGELKCVQSVPNNFGYESFNTFNAEKFDIKNRIEFLSKITVEGRTSLLCTAKSRKEIYLYDSIELNAFRKVSLDLIAPGKLFGRNEDIIADNCFLTKSSVNYMESVLKLNPPFMQTSKGGSYSNDYSSSIERVFMKLLNEDKEAVKGVYIAGTAINNLGKDDDIFSVYKLEKTSKILNGYEIKIVSNENDKVLEILGIDTKIKVISD